MRLALIQRFSEVLDHVGLAVLSIIPGNSKLWTILMENFNLGIGKMSLTFENPLLPNPVLPKTSVSVEFGYYKHCTEKK